MKKIKELNKPLVRGILFYLKKSGLKQGTIAQKAGYSIQELSYMLNGRKIIKGCDVIKIANALNITPNDIFLEGGFELKNQEMKIGDMEIKEILVTTEDNELIASVSAENIVEKDGFKVVCVPYEI